MVNVSDIRAIPPEIFPNLKMTQRYFSLLFTCLAAISLYKDQFKLTKDQTIQWKLNYTVTKEGISDTSFIIQRSLFLAFCPISFFPTSCSPAACYTESHYSVQPFPFLDSILCCQEQKKEQLYYKDLFKSWYLTCFPAFRIVFLLWFLPSQYIRKIFSSLNIYIHKALATRDIAVKFLLTSSIILLNCLFF